MHIIFYYVKQVERMIWYSEVYKYEECSLLYYQLGELYVH